MAVLIDARMGGIQQRGIGRYIDELLANIPASDREGVYALVRPGQSVPKGITPILADARWYTIKEQWVVVQAILSVRPALVHIPHINVPVGLSLWRRFGKGPKLVVTVHDLLLVSSPMEQATTLSPVVWRLKYWAYRLTVRLAFSAADAIIAVSQRTAREIQDILPPVLHTKVKVIPEGISSNVRNPCQGPDRCSLKDAPPYVLTVGSCYPHKRLNWVFEALERLWKQGIGLHWIHAGPVDALSDRLFSAVGHPERIQPVGVLSDPELYHRYAHALALIYPSSSEGYGLPPLEALECGGRVVSAPVPSLTRLAVPAGQLRLIDSVEQLVEALLDFWKTRSHTPAPFTAALRTSSSVWQTVQLYRSLLSCL